MDYKRPGQQKVRDLDYTVVTEQELPEELQKEIDERYTEDFKMTCMLDDSLYIVRGFGMQETGGYSIQVQDLYLAQNAIYFEADLLGPENVRRQKRQSAIRILSSRPNDWKKMWYLNRKGETYGIKNRSSLYGRKKGTRRSLR